MFSFPHAFFRTSFRTALLGAAWLAVSSCSESTAAPASLEDLAKGSLSQVEGEISIAGLTAPVEVIRDEWGIPHIYAQNTEDLFLAQGYVVAQDRLWQMELWRRWHEGRLSEIHGPVAFDYDKRTRLMMFRGPWDEKEWTSYHPEGEKIFTAFANGVNAYISEHADNLPVEFKLTGVTPDPWTAETVLLRWAQLGLSSVRGHAINEIQLARDVASMGVEAANKKFAPDPWDDLKVPAGLDVSVFTDEVLAAAQAGDGDPFEPGKLPTLAVVDTYKDLVPEATQTALLAPPWDPRIDQEGSNNWVMSPSRSSTGKVILSNDPHRRIEMPALRYFVHLNAPGWNVVGGGEPPFAGVDAGNNETMAWGFTFAGADMVDLYVEETNPANPNEVKWQGGWEPMRTLTEQIVVKGEAQPRTVELKFTRHGPVFFEDGKGHAFAVRSVVQEAGTAAYKGSFKLAQAESCEDFFQRAMFWMVPTHNLICGDTKGNIALQVTGLVPDRDGWNGRLPVPGDGRYEWKGFREDLPREYNPARGYIVTANNNTTQPEGYKGRPIFYHTTNGVPIARITRLHQLLGTGAKLSVQDHEKIQHDAYSLQAERDHPLFEGWTSQNADVEKARQMIAGWDFQLTRETVPGALFVTWAGQVDAKALNAATPAAERRALVEAGLEKTIQKLATEHGADWNQWHYGRVNNLSPLPHSIARAFDIPSVDRPGAFNTVNANGANFRRIVDLSNLDNSVWTNAPGQSGQPGSLFYDNMRDNLANGEYAPMLFTKGAIDQHAKYRLTLKPGR
jgi:penicillin G amidase